MKLALFDLDHTLIPFDSGLAWTRFLAARGVLPSSAEEVYLAYARQYVAGTLDIRAMHQANMAPLLRYPVTVLESWAREFEAAMAPRLPGPMQALVRRHLDAGDLCAIVTATQRLVATPFARLFCVPHLVATEAAVVDGLFTGAIEGQPCFREYKVERVTAWLARLAAADGPARTLDGYAQSWFYSDSIGDLPLLEAVTHPVAVQPDARLRAHAQASGWPVLDGAAQQV
jgi:HAD superfamily hydrolase (TIGR01490 family)